MKKTLFISIIFLIIAGILVLFFQNATNISQNSIPNLTQTHSDSKSIRTPESNTGWGVSPFASGNAEKKSFQKPNIIWKPKTLQIQGKWVSYEFGKGNPHEVSLDQEGLEKLNQRCQEILDTTNSVSSNSKWREKNCDPESSRPYYVSSQVEYNTLSALDPSTWENLYTKCEVGLRYGDTFRNAGENHTLTFDTLFSSGALDIEKLITIDEETGRKRLNLELSLQIVELITSARSEIQGMPTGNPDGNCIDTYSKGISESLVQAIQEYKLPP